MTTPGDNTEELLAFFRNGDKAARDRLIAHTMERLRIKTRQMLKDYPVVHRWEETDDVLQKALMRLCRALEATKPESARHFFRLAALQIRRELLDLAAHYLGPQGLGANHRSDPRGEKTEGRGNALDKQSEEPDCLEEWSEFHKCVEALPEEEREVFGLLWYQGLTLKASTTVLGVSLSTVKRRWQSARLKLAKGMDGERPE